MKGLGVRVASAVALLVPVLLALWFRGPLLMLLVALAAGLGAHEFYMMARHAGYRPWYAAGVALSLLLGVRAYVGSELGALPGGERAGLPAEGLALSLLAFLLIMRQGYLWFQAVPVAAAAGLVQEGSAPRGPSAAWANAGLTLGGAIYTGGLVGYAALIAEQPSTGGVDPRAWLLLVLLGTAACDTGAYFVGSLLGKHKLIPHISPAKTWEGLGGGVLGAVIAALALSALLGLSPVQGVLLGLLICAAAVSGDLCESLIKRAVGVKDSSHLIPGHGGMLDRLDSILFVLVAVYWFIQIVR